VVVRVRDERLAWLAVQPKLRRRSNRHGPLGVLATLLTLGFITTLRRRRKPAERMSVYSVAVDHVAGFLDDHERATLRTGGTVPRWFLKEVERSARAVRRNQPLPAPSR
jgi:hypothetical protein